MEEVLIHIEEILAAIAVIVSSILAYYRGTHAEPPTSGPGRHIARLVNLDRNSVHDES